MRGFILRTLSTRVMPVAYLVALNGAIYGVAFSFFSWSAGVQNTILFKSGALIGVEFWGLFTLVASITLIIGMIRRDKIVTGAGALGMFLVWTFASIVYLTGGYYYLLLPLALVNMLCHGYFYLAASLDRMWDYTPT